MKKIRELEIRNVLIILGLVSFFLLSIPSFGRQIITVIQDDEFFSRVKSGVTHMVDDMWYKSIFAHSRFSRIDTIATYYETGQISSTQVLKGKEGWLFYKTVTDGDPIADYEGKNLYNGEELKEIYNVITEVERYLNDRGIELEIVIGPNKEIVYSEYMPESYKLGNTSKTKELFQYLDGNGINVSYPLDNMQRIKNDYQLYYRYDTHWNQLGGYVATQDAVAKLGCSLKDLDIDRISSEPLVSNHHYCASEDLAGLTALTSVFNDDLEYRVEDIVNIDWDSFEEEYNEERMSLIKNPNAQSHKSILVIGDSFRTAMLPALSECFENVYVTHRNYFKPIMLEEANPDIVMVEYVERHVDGIFDIRDEVMGK